MARPLAACVALSLLAAPLPAFAQQNAQAIAPIISADALHLPRLATSGMVSSQEAQASRAGAAILEAGGNAVDAAVATAFALAVTLPRAGNIGGGGFMLIHRAAAKETVAVDYREVAPAASTPTMFLDDKGNPDPKKSRDSGLAVGVPGTVAGLALAHERYGSGKFTLAQLMAPAIRMARQGIAVLDDLPDALAVAAPRLARYPSTAKIWLVDGKAPPRGSRIVQEDLARTLEAIAQRGPAAFYEGETAEKIVEAVKGAGGVMTLDDMKNYRVMLRQPLRGTYKGHEVISMPPPSSGGVHLIQLLNLLEPYDLRGMGHNSAATIHVMVEAMKLAYADRAAFLGDPDRVKVPVRGLISKAYASELRKGIDPGRARPAKEVSAGNPLPYESEQTTHFSVIDKDGNAVANTYTLNLSFGVGMVAEGTGVLLNNEMDDFAAKAGAQNAFGLVQGEANLPEAGKRPLSSMTPTFLMRDGKPVLITGSPGGSRIITIVLNTILNSVDHGMNIAEAVHAPRVHHQWLPDAIDIEKGISPDTLRILQSLGHTLAPKPSFGSANSIAITTEGIAGASDPRQRGTLAVGD